MDVGVVERVVANSLISLLASGLGIYLSSTGEHRPRRTFYMMVFAVLGIVGVTSTFFVEQRNEQERRSEQSESNFNQSRLSIQLASLSDENAFLRGKLETIGSVLGGIAAKPSDTSAIAGLLATSSRTNQRSGPMLTVDANRDLLKRIGSTYGDGERLKEICRTSKPTEIGDSRPFEQWERDSTSELTEKFGLEVLGKAGFDIPYSSASPSISPFCWGFVMKVNQFEYLIQSNGGTH